MEPFTVPFNVSAHHHKVWIAPADGSAPEVELHIKGTNWAGFQANGCVNELWKHNLTEYVDYLSAQQFNAVRLPLNGDLVNRASFTIDSDYQCGSDFEDTETMEILDIVIALLRSAGIFVMLDMHTLAYPESNLPLWCPNGAHDNGCTRGLTRPATERFVFQAWDKLAQRYCSSPNVILADLFNEPSGAQWGGHSATNWKSFAERMGDYILGICPRWLIAVQGVGGSGYWWGENIRGQLSDPVTLSLPHRLVMSPHTYGHNLQMSYMRAADFPANMPRVWRSLWADVCVGEGEGPPCVLGEWGGMMQAVVWNNKALPNTTLWQIALRDFLLNYSMGARGGSLSRRPAAPTWPTHPGRAAAKAYAGPPRPVRPARPLGRAAGLPGGSPPQGAPLSHGRCTARAQVSSTGRPPAC